MRASLIRNLLESKGIQAFVENQLMGSIAPWQGSAGGVSPVKVIISSMDYDEAVRLIEAFEEEPL